MIFLISLKQLPSSESSKVRLQLKPPQLGGRGCDNVPVVGDVALFRRARYRKVVMW